MKKLIILLAVMFITATNWAQKNDENADKVIGVWQTGSGKGRVQITKYGDKYGGKIVWLRDPNDTNGKPKTDNKNPDPAKRTNTTLGLNNLLGFKYAGKGKYEGGSIYDPENGKTYSCTMTLDGDNILNVRGYIGISLIGRTDKWTRVN